MSAILVPGEAAEIPAWGQLLHTDIRGSRGESGIMKLATTADEQRRWIEQWREAAIALDEVRRDELSNLTD